MRNITKLIIKNYLRTTLSNGNLNEPEQNKLITFTPVRIHTRARVQAKQNNF
jgi:hypothetical protein